MTDALQGIETTENGHHLSIVGRDIESIPDDLVDRFGASIRALDFSFNQIKKVQHLEKFTNLVSLVLDNNEVEDLNDMPVLPNLETLWVNNNRIADLESLLSVLEKNFPKLRYLSILKNPACPNEFTFHDTDDYQRYRFYVLWRLKNLKFLDSKEVTPVERKEADKRGKFCKVVVPDYNQIQKQAMDTGSPQMEAMPQKVLEPGDSKQPSSYFGYTKHVYTGKHSEGNRFIKNNDL